MSREGAAIVTNMLEGVVQEGTGRNARILQGPVAGKTGTTNNYQDALFIGFSPAIAAGVWVGLDSGGTLGDRETGAKAALPIWIQFMKNAPQPDPLHILISRIMSLKCVWTRKPVCSRPMDLKMWLRDFL